MHSIELRALNMKQKIVENSLSWIRMRFSKIKDDYELFKWHIWLGGTSNCKQYETTVYWKKKLFYSLKRTIFEAPNELRHDERLSSLLFLIGGFTSLISISTECCVRLRPNRVIPLRTVNTIKITVMYAFINKIEKTY